MLMGLENSPLPAPWRPMVRRCTVRVPQNLNAAVARVADDEVALGVKRQEAMVATPILATSIATNAAQVRAIAELEHFHARVVIKHGKITRAVASDSGGIT
jgi:antitoxin component of MazEF toxin-antitoxin module